MAQKGKARLLPNGLTPKQDRFKNKILEQIMEGKQPNATQAALEVYDTTDKGVAGTIGEENMNKPEIREQIDKALSDQGITSAQIVQNINKIASADIKEPSAETVLRSNLSLLKLLGYDISQKGALNGRTMKHQVRKLTYDDAKKEITELTTSSEFFVEDADDKTA